MADRQQTSTPSLPEIVRIARELEYTNQSIQYTADAERRSHEQALIEAFRKHQEIRRAAEREGERAVQDLANEQQLLEQEQALRAERARKEAAERAWRLEQQRRDALADALAAEEAAEHQRQANAAAREKLNAPRPLPPPTILKSPVTQAQSPVATQAATESALPLQRHDSFAIKEKAPVVDVVKPVSESAQVPPKYAPAPSRQDKALANSSRSGSTYQGLPLPATLLPELQQEYLQYIEILMQLKEHRRIFKDQILPDPQYRQAKAAVGDDRRFIRKSVSQLTEDRKKNKEIMDAVMRKINASLQSPFPKVSMSRFIPGLQGPEVSSLYIYLLNVFTKAIFAQYLVDASSDTRKADAIGMFASQILATVQLRWENRISLWPLLVAKFARRCPVLFGVYGDDDTAEGKILLGWGKEDGKFVTDQRHAERMTGLSAGWASITLRDYSKSKMENPAPSWYFWRSVALIVNVPARNVTATHYLVLKGLIEHNEQRILKLFGDYGRMVLRQAVLDFPNNEYTGQNVSAQGLRLLRDVWDKDLHLRFV